ncbi:hypothetical protein JST97_02525 [bacterium]|nr:hypothetical protein [bacterium]
MNFEEIAFELYGLPLDEFVAARDARSAEARKDKQRQLANDLKGLVKPTVGAWAVNRLLRGSRTALEQLLQVGESLRRAQSQLEAERIRELSVQRRHLTAQLAAELRRMSLSDSAEQEVLDTLAAAVAESSAAELVRSGRLARGLSPSGFGDLAGLALASPPAPVAAPDPAIPAPEPVSQPEAPEEPEVPSSEPEILPAPVPEAPPPLQAGPSARTLQRKLERAQEDLEEAQAEQEAARERVESLRQRLAAARDRLKVADEAVRQAQAECDEVQELIDEL